MKKKLKPIELLFSIIEQVIFIGIIMFLIKLVHNYTENGNAFYYVPIMILFVFIIPSYFIIYLLKDFKTKSIKESLNKNISMSKKNKYLDRLKSYGIVVFTSIILPLCQHSCPKLMI